MGMNEPNRYRAVFSSNYAASGYAAVWARENTRRALFDAMKRREVYATTGPRMTVRFFAGWDFEQGDAASPNLAAIGYREGVPMGGDLTAAPEGTAPSFLVRAVKDPDGANLDRVQVVKGWRDRAGRMSERVYDVALRWERGEARQSRPVGIPWSRNATYVTASAPPTECGVARSGFRPRAAAFSTAGVQSRRRRDVTTRFYDVVQDPEAALVIQEGLYSPTG